MPQLLSVFLYKKRHLFLYEYLFLLLLLLIVIQGNKRSHREHNVQLHSILPLTTKLCVQLDRNTLRARHKSCFLRPDTGPCRADIIQYYFDAMVGTCYRFFWGGCQGNGNRFEDKATCMNYCYLNSSMNEPRRPNFCNLAFDFGTCFGHYNRWAWDKLEKTCKRRLYSGCGGNQNNFETRNECIATCLTAPNNTMTRLRKFTTCIPFTVDGMH